MTSKAGLRAIVLAILPLFLIPARAPAHAEQHGVPRDVAEVALGGDPVRLSNGLYRVTLPDGYSMTTHGPDPMDGHGRQLGPGDPERPPVCNTGHVMHVLYGHPAVSSSRFEAVKEEIRAHIRRTNAVLNEAALESGGTTADYKVLCDESGQIRVDEFANQTNSPSFAEIVEAARSADFDDPNVDYLIFYDGNTGAACGFGEFHSDNSPSASNENNSGGYGVTYEDCWFSRTPMHENGHTQGAVQPGAPNADLTDHCFEHEDIMCYPYPDLSPKCPTVIQFDCGFDTYFDARPETGEWLESHWNIGSRVNRYIVFGDQTPSPEPSPPSTEDTWFARQWALRQVNAPQAWQLEQATGAGVKVAVVGTGVDLEHEDLQCPGKLEVVPGANLTGDEGTVDDIGGMGTQVAGVIGACTHNGKGIAGVAPDATILPFRIYGGESDWFELLDQAIRAATDAGAHVIVFPEAFFVDFGPQFASRAEEAADYAASKGAVVVFAAGDTPNPWCSDPATARNSICVGAVDSRKQKSWMGNFPFKTRGPAVVGPGGQELFLCREWAEVVISTYPVERGPSCMESGGYRSFVGTAPAAAHVAGIAALAYERVGGDRADVNRHAVVDAIVSSATDLGIPGYDPVYGSGLVDALATVQSLTPPSPPPTSPPPTSPPPSPTDPPTPTEEAADVSFTSDSATAGQYSDTATIAARLVDGSGDPIAGTELVFDLVRDGASNTWTATTDDDGVARKTVALDESPGSYQLTVRYAGKAGQFTGDADVTGFVVEKEDTTSTLTVVGTGADRQMSARLADADNDSGLVDKAIQFFVDGDEIGAATTDSNGVATTSLPARYRNGHHTYQVVFAGDTYYLRSEDRERT